MSVGGIARAARTQGLHSSAVIGPEGARDPRFWRSTFQRIDIPLTWWRPQNSSRSAALLALTARVPDRLGVSAEAFSCRAARAAAVELGQNLLLKLR